VSVPVVHAVTDDIIVARGDFLERARGVMTALGARGAVQLRAPAMEGRPLYEMALALAELQRSTGCWLVVNDRLDVAAACGAIGAQLTSRSIAIADARAAVPPPSLRLGVSVHDADEARRASAEGASWLVAGHVHDTASHPGEPGRGERFVADVVAAAAGTPVIAIGGLRPAHLGALRRAGAHGAAAIRGIWGAADSARAAGDYLSAYDADP